MAGVFVLCGGGEIRTHLNAGVRWTPAATSANTGGHKTQLNPTCEQIIGRIFMVLLMQPRLLLGEELSATAD